MGLDVSLEVGSCLLLKMPPVRRQNLLGGTMYNESASFNIQQDVNSQNDKNQVPEPKQKLILRLIDCSDYIIFSEAVL